MTTLYALGRKRRVQPWGGTTWNDGRMRWPAFYTNPDVMNLIQADESMFKVFMSAAA